MIVFNQPCSPTYSTASLQREIDIIDFIMPIWLVSESFCYKITVVYGYHEFETHYKGVGSQFASLLADFVTKLHSSKYHTENRVSFQAMLRSTIKEDKHVRDKTNINTLVLEFVRSVLMSAQFDNIMRSILLSCSTIVKYVGWYL